jgi:hypothetical protein
MPALIEVKKNMIPDSNEPFSPNMITAAIIPFIMGMAVLLPKRMSPHPVILRVMKMRHKP